MRLSQHRLTLFFLGLFALPWPASVSATTPGAAFTLEQILSAPFPSELVAAPAGGAVAWVFDARGARNIWIAQPPDYRGRPVTAYSDDDGEEITNLTFTMDGKHLVYVRGGEPNRAGEIPNPRSDPAGTSQAVYVVAAAGGEPRRLGDGGSATVSPRGGRVAFVQKGKVWWAPLEGSEKPSQAFQARGECGTLRWSPDGSRLAFLRIPSAPAAREVLRPHREGPPWSIRVGDPVTGAGREVFRADTGRGSVFREVSARSQLLWAGGDRLVFPWEKEGWTLLYAVPASGGTPVLLTPGAFEVEYVNLSPDRKTVLYNSNQDDLERRHLWSVSANGGRPAALTRGDGLEWSPVQTSDGQSVAFLRSDAKRHPAPVIRLGGADRELAPGSVPAGFPEKSLVVPETVIFSATDGLPIHAQLFRPADLAPGQRRPAVAFFHGGSRRQMLPGFHYMSYYRNAYAFNQYLASRGFVVLSVNFRSGIGYGLEFREALGFGAMGASEYRDVAGAGLYLRGRTDVDPSRIGLWGGSYGGYLTALALARASDLFAAGVDLHGVHDWRDWFRVVLGEEARDADAARLAFASSPMADVKTWRSPVLLIHGDDDRNVPFRQSVDLVEALRARGVTVEQLVFPDEVHDFLVHAHFIEAFRAAADFLERHLGAKRPAP